MRVALAATLFVACCSSASDATAATQGTSTPTQASAIVRALNGSTLLRGTGIGSAGDVDGDGRDDLLAAVPSLDVAGRQAAGGVLVTRAVGRDQTSFRLRRSGLSIFGPRSRARIGGSAAGVGDLNGDGRDDIAVAVTGIRPGYRTIYGVFSQPAVVELGGSAVPALRVDVPLSEHIGDPVGVGDVNGDGRDDIAVAWNRGVAPTISIIYGQTASTATTVGTPSSPGFEITGAEAVPESIQIAAAGDLNADGRGDIVLGQASEDAPCQCGGGAAVIFGRAETTPVSLDSPGPSGYLVRGLDDAIAVAGIGDTNGDRRPDVLIRGSRTYVLFGRASRVHGSGKSGYTIDERGFGGVAGLGDLNADGLRDFAVGPYVIFGGRSTRRLDPRRLGARGFRVDDERVASNEIDLSGLGNIDRRRGDELLVRGQLTGLSERTYASVLSGVSPPLVAIAPKRNRSASRQVRALRRGNRGLISLPLLCPATSARCRGVVAVRRRGRTIRKRVSLRPGRLTRVEVGIGELRTRRFSCEVTVKTRWRGRTWVRRGNLRVG